MFASQELSPAQTSAMEVAHELQERSGAVEESSLAAPADEIVVEDLTRTAPSLVFDGPVEPLSTVHEASPSEEGVSSDPVEDLFYRDPVENVVASVDVDPTVRALRVINRLHAHEHD